MNRKIQHETWSFAARSLLAIGALPIAWLAATPAQGQTRQTVTVTKQDCQWLVKSDPDGVDYRAGVDVHGRKVASADLSSSGNAGVGNNVGFDITPGLLANYGIDLRHTGLAGDAGLGKIEIKNGAVSIGGKRVGINERQGLAALCRDKL